VLDVGAELASRVAGQINITASDMFNKPGQYYRAYANAANNTSVGVSGCWERGRPSALGFYQRP
jgi:hypothetical protein